MNGMLAYAFANDADAMKIGWVVMVVIRARKPIALIMFVVVVDYLQCY